MTQDDDPLISIVTVNFNGKKFLENLFGSILNLDYPSERLQIIMVDNGSTDGSVDLVRKRFPQVEIVKLSENLGYAGGNNEGFKRAKGSYIALINNDCIVEENWLKEMLSIFRQSSDDSRIGAVGSKVVFFYSYLPLRFITISASPRELKREKDCRRLGVSVSDVRILNAGSSKDVKGKEENERLLNRSVKYLDGFYPGIPDSEGNIHHWTQDSAFLAIPIYNMDEDIDLEFVVSSYLSPNSLQIVIGEEIFYSLEVEDKPRKVKLRIPKRFFASKKDIINSCGVKINKFFYSQDRGFMSFDEGQYSRIEEIFSPSGSSLLLDRRMLEDIGYFDQSFFTYYEDIDLFWRARLKGWKMFFTPNAVARHVHCGSGKEWSYSFTYHVVRNRLLMIFKCGWATLFIRCYFAFVLSMIFTMFIYVASTLMGRKPDRIDIPIRIRVFFELFYLLPKNLVARFKIRSGKRVSDKVIKSWIRSF